MHWFKMSDLKNKNATLPYAKIVVEPSNNNVRFRHSHKGKFVSNISGDKNNNYDNAYSAIQIFNYKGPVKVFISCVEKQEPFYPHPYGVAISGKKSKRGVCFFVEEESEDMKISFENMTIECVRAKSIETTLLSRQTLQVDPFKTGYRLREAYPNIDLNSVRLCFQVYLQSNKPGMFDVALPPLVSQVLHDKRDNIEPTIVYISHTSGPVDGGIAICILCEKVDPNNIQVRFFEKNNGWSAIAELVPPYVFRKVSVVFKLPHYSNQSISQPIQVFVQLERISDGETSEPKPFTFLPLNLRDDYRLKKRQRTCVDGIPDGLLENDNLFQNCPSDVEPWQLPECPRRPDWVPVSPGEIAASQNTFYQIPGEELKVKPQSLSIWNVLNNNSHKFVDKPKQSMIPATPRDESPTSNIPASLNHTLIYEENTGNQNISCSLTKSQHTTIDRNMGAIPKSSINNVTNKLQNQRPPATVNMYNFQADDGGKCINSLQRNVPNINPLNPIADQSKHTNQNWNQQRNQEWEYNVQDQLDLFQRIPLTNLDTPSPTINNLMCQDYNANEPSALIQNEESAIGHSENSRAQQDQIAMQLKNQHASYNVNAQQPIDSYPNYLSVLALPNEEGSDVNMKESCTSRDTLNSVDSWIKDLLDSAGENDQDLLDTNKVNELATGLERECAPFVPNVPQTFSNGQALNDLGAHSARHMENNRTNSSNYVMNVLDNISENNQNNPNNLQDNFNSNMITQDYQGCPIQNVNPLIPFELRDQAFTPVQPSQFFTYRSANIVGNDQSKYSVNPFDGDYANQEAGSDEKEYDENFVTSNNAYPFHNNVFKSRPPRASYVLFPNNHELRK